MSFGKKEFKGRYEYVPSELVEKISNGNVVYFLGSSFLDPPRNWYLDEIKKYVYLQLARNVSKRESQDRGGFRETFRAIGDIAQPDYFELNTFLKEKWSVPDNRFELQNSDIYQLMSNSENVKALITSSFDTYIRKTLADSKFKKKVRLVTGYDSIRGEDSKGRELIDTEVREKDLLLYQLFGDIDYTRTLYLTERDLFDLRHQIVESKSAVQFIQSIIKDKTLINIGYEDDDIYDNSFRQLVNDISLETGQPLAKDIFFINESTYYGLWGTKDEINISVIPLTSSSFIAMLGEALSSER